MCYFRGGRGRRVNQYGRRQRAVQPIVSHRCPPPPELGRAEEQQATDLFGSSDEHDPRARNAQLKVASELVRPPLQLLVHLEKKKSKRMGGAGSGVELQWSGGWLR